MNSVDLGGLPRWDLSNVYPSLESDQFTSATVGLKNQVAALDRYLDEHQISWTVSKAELSEVKARIDDYLDQMNAAQRLYLTLNSFVVLCDN